MSAACLTTPWPRPCRGSTAALSYQFRTERGLHVRGEREHQGQLPTLQPMVHVVEHDRCRSGTPTLASGRARRCSYSMIVMSMSSGSLLGGTDVEPRSSLRRPAFRCSMAGSTPRTVSSASPGPAPACGASGRSEDLRGLDQHRRGDLGHHLFLVLVEGDPERGFVRERREHLVDLVDAEQRRRAIRVAAAVRRIKWSCASTRSGTCPARSATAPPPSGSLSIRRAGPPVARYTSWLTAWLGVAGGRRRTDRRRGRVSIGQMGEPARRNSAFEEPRRGRPVTWVKIQVALGAGCVRSSRRLPSTERVRRLPMS